MTPSEIFEKLFGFIPDRYHRIREKALEKLDEIRSMNSGAQNTFARIVENIEKDRFWYKKRLLKSLLAQLSRLSKDLRTLFKDFCNTNQLKGTRIEVLPHTLGHATGLEKLSRDLSTQTKLDDYEADTGIRLEWFSQDAWRTRINRILSNYVGLSENDMINKQESEVRMIPLNLYLQWSTFNLRDPCCCAFKEAGDNHETIWQNLGLDNSLKKGSDTMLLFTFEPSRNNIKHQKKTFHKPTAFDAGWNPQWSPNPGHRYGMTHPHPHPGEDSWPEMVHRPVMGPKLRLPLRKAL